VQQVPNLNRFQGCILNQEPSKIKRLRAKMYFILTILQLSETKMNDSLTKVKFYLEKVNEPLAKVK
jgi:hypothetical protein